MKISMNANGSNFQMNLNDTHQRIYLKPIHWRRITRQVKSYIKKSTQYKVTFPAHPQPLSTDKTQELINFISKCQTYPFDWNRI